MSSDCGKVNGLAAGPALTPGQGTLAINGSTDLSSCVVGNYDGKVFQIYNSRRDGGYEYEIWVLAQARRQLSALVSGGAPGAHRGRRVHAGARHRAMIDAARKQVSITVNAALTGLYWQIGQRVHTEVLEERRSELSYLSSGTNVVPAVPR